MKGLKLLFMGTPSFALPSLEQLYLSAHPLCAVVTQPDRPYGRRRELRSPPVKEWARQHDLPVLQPARLDDGTFFETVQKIAPDLIVVVAYGRILPPALLELPPRRCINLHASLLPAYRGAAPIERAVIDGVSGTGVTVMGVTEELDAGDIILQERLPVHFTDSAGKVAAGLAAAGARLLLQAIGEIASGEARYTPQDHARATVAPPLRPGEERLDWSGSALTLHNRIRGLDPRPGAYTFFRERRLKIWKALPAVPDEAALKQRKAAAFPGEAAPGTILALENGRIFVAAGEGSSLELLEVQPAGKERITAGDFYRGYRLSTGERLGK